jgi:capsular polysaccharide biosynthesis protein
LAVALAFFSFYKVSFADGFDVSYRQGQTWQASETLLINQRGLLTNPAPGPQSNPGWLTSLTSLYAQIANSATIRTRVFPGGITTKATGDYSASQVFDQNNQPLSVLTFDGTGSSPGQAAGDAGRAASQFRYYVNAQSAGQTKNRVLISVLSPAEVRTAKVVKGRKLTNPILIFLAVFLAAIGLAYVLENLKPKKAPGEPPAARPGRRRRAAAVAPASRRREPVTEPRPLESLPEPVETITRP